jgi:hypothetical protein
VSGESSRWELRERERLTCRSFSTAALAMESEEEAAAVAAGGEG